MDERTKKLDLWDSFCRRHEIISRSVLLFDSSARRVSVLPYGRNGRPVLRRSSDFDRLVVSEARKLIADHESEAGEYEGLIYMMFWAEGGRVVPLYVGKAEKLGRGGGNLSANVAAVERDQGKFCRWGYNYAYHIGDLSAAACPGHPAEKINPKYARWADRLFEAWPSEAPRLRRETRFWAEAWRRGATGIWEEYGATSLTFLEYLLIGVAGDLFPETLLNDEGVNRR